MGNNLDLTHMLGAPKTVECPTCKREVDLGADDCDIECGDPNPSPGVWQLGFWCEHCDTDGVLAFTISLKVQPPKVVK